VLAAAHTDELATEAEAHTLEQFHASEAKWLSDYLVGKACDAECKANLIDVMITGYFESRGDYDAAVQRLLESPPKESKTAIERLHTRILRCQVEDKDLAALRDHVLVPAAADLVKRGDATTRRDVLDLLAIVPEPSPANAAPWTALLAQLDKLKVGKEFRDHRAIAARQKQGAANARRVSFCAVPAPPGQGSAAPPPTTH
jgi:hypothetical protein